MLEIRNITKVYETDGFKQCALDNVSVNFRKSEFASILGPSGSGKTTFLNIIGGLDHYTEGDLIINEISTKKFKDSDWDSYRNHRIGFVFQSYNLIGHQSVLRNVMLALTLSGISKKESIERAKKALIDVGLAEHMYKRPNQLSGGQMQRVAIARALVNNPEILLADEPTGALDSVTSVQIMELLKEIAKDKLVIMVTHNPDLAKEYANRIINLKDGKIVSDTNPYNGNVNTKENKKINDNKTKKTKMSFLTALGLSFNNLMTKKGRTILVAFAGSIGIIGISLILALSNGFSGYIDKIQEDTLTSYPLNIMQESTDITGALLSMTTKTGENRSDGKIIEQQQITSMLKNVSTNDLKSFKKYLDTNYNKVSNDLATVKNTYSVSPFIYTIDSTKKIAKLNPSDFISSFYGNGMMKSLSNYTSIFTQMVDNTDMLDESFDVLKGHWPEKYDELVIVLQEKNAIPDLLVYALGFRDTKELEKIINKIMTGGTVDIKDSNPKEFTYDDLMNVEMRMIMPTDFYKYNSKYDLYEDMSEDDDYLKNLYSKATKLKIVGIVAPKEGVTTMALTPGVIYREDLVDYIIDYSKNTDIVKKQLSNDTIDVISGNKFDNENNKLDLNFRDLVDVDENKISEAFNIKIDEESLTKETTNYMKEISNSITTNTDPAYNIFNNGLTKMISELSLSGNIEFNNINEIVNNVLNNNDDLLSSIEKDYLIPKDKTKLAYSGLLKGLLQTYITSYNQIDSTLTTDTNNPIALYNEDMFNEIKNNYLSSAMVTGVINTMAKGMTEAKMNKDILGKVGDLTNTITKSFANAFNVNPDKIADAFKLKMSQEEITRIISSMISDTEVNAKTNLITLGYQDKDEPTYMSFYFNSFDGKEHFMKFIDEYNDKMKKENMEDKVINYTDTTGILMDSVKTIVNAVSYVLIGFVSISLVVSSIMIGIITYISVFERTKEIGILRAIGASKRNISSIFNAETFIVGLLSGLFGIGISYLLIPIINAVIHHYTGNIPLSAILYLNNAILLIILSIILTLIGGLIPSRSASKKDPVEALRSE